MKKRTLFLAVAVALFAPVVHAGDVSGPAAQGLEYAICVSTVDHPEPRFDSQWTDAPAARARQAAILADGWVIASDSGRQEDSYPAHAVIKVRFIDLNLDASDIEGRGLPCGVSPID